MNKSQLKRYFFFLTIEWTKSEFICNTLRRDFSSNDLLLTLFDVEVPRVRMPLLSQVPKVCWLTLIGPRL